jgi:hypothetical protein
MFLAETSVPSVVFIFCAPGVVSIGTGNVGSRLNVLRSRTHFQRYRVRQVPYSYFARSDSFLVLPRASVPVFMFCVPGLIFGGIEGVGSRLNVLRARTRYRRYLGRPVLISCFAISEMFSAMPSASGHVFMFSTPRMISAITRAKGPVFMFCVSGLVFGGTESVGSRFHV